MKNQLSAQYLISEALQAIADEPAQIEQERREFLSPLYDRLWREEYDRQDREYQESVLLRLRYPHLS